MTEILRKKVDASLERREVTIDKFVILVGVGDLLPDNPVPHGIGFTHELKRDGCVYEARTAKPLKKYIH